jgi:hypothetical protein
LFNLVGEINMSSGEQAPPSWSEKVRPADKSSRSIDAETKADGNQEQQSASAESLAMFESLFGTDPELDQQILTLEQEIARDMDEVMKDMRERQNSEDVVADNPIDTTTNA